MEKQTNIIVIDSCVGTQCTLHKALIDANFNIHHIEISENIALENVPFKPELIIYYYNHKSEPELFWKCLKSQENNPAPYVVITSSTDDAFIANLVKSQAEYFIQLPCRKEHLYSRLNEIISHSSKPFPDDDFNLDIQSDNIPLRGKVSKKRLMHLAESLLNNSIHQQGILSKSRLATESEKHEASNEEMKKIREMEEKVKEALDNDRFQLYFQPVHSLDDDRLTGFESLIRWFEPDQGLIPPDDFIPLAEKSDAIIDLGFWIIEEGIKRAKEIQETFPSETPLYININLSARQFTHPHLSETIIQQVKNYSITNSMINFEITEGAFMDDMEQANLMLLKLKNEGFRIYMDDFGTGYSSLTYLLHFPVDCIKIDKSFVQWMHIDEDSEHIVKSVIYLAHNLKIDVLTEGVESQEHITMLKELKCNYSQGYFHAKPMPIKETLEYVEKHLAPAR